MDSREIGGVTVTTVVELDGPMFEADLLPQLTPEMIEENADWIIPRHYDPASELLVMPVQSFLIKTAHHTIVVDGCFGNHKERVRPDPRFGMLDTPWLERLADAGATPDEVDFVMCSHLHADHVGWNTKLEDGRWVPTFPNAKYLFAEAEWDFWQEMMKTGERPTQPMVDSVLPVVEAGQSVLVDDGHEIEDGITLDMLAGHTPGHMGFHIRDNGSEAILTGDMIHHPLQIKYPDWSTSVCVDREAAARTRRNFIETYAETGAVIAPAHFPTPTFGFIEVDGETFTWRYDE